MAYPIDGFGFSSFRSFGDEVQIISPCSKINIIIGQNNSGKSNILLFLDKYFNNILLSLKNGEGISFVDLDKHKGLQSEKIFFSIGFTPDRFVKESFYTSVLGSNGHSTELLKTLMSSETLHNQTGLIWFQLSASWDKPFLFDTDWINQIANNRSFSAGQWQSLRYQITNQQGGGLRTQWIPETLHRIAKSIFENISVIFIPAFRSVRNQNEEGKADNSGAGIIQSLAQFQNPDLQHLSKKDDFERINSFLQEVTDNQSARLEIPHNREYILVHMDGKTLPLSSLGTGIHELIILAAQATLRKNCVICVEEPELHMHPILQKRLIKYLQNNTDNQYFISTHSAHILDTQNTSLFHIFLQNGSSRIKYVNDNNQKFFVCNDLGYKASDLLQTNCIIWVEGPSDRLYINFWIQSINPNLIEGLHYSIMFYGGRLLSHLSADDTEVNDFINLRKLNMNLAIVIDSDKSNKTKSINDTKKRIRTEFDTGPGFAWITSGREIENYIEPNLLASSINSVHPSAILPSIIDQFSDCLNLVNKKGDPIPANKVKIAHNVIENPANLDIYDLHKQIMKLVGFIEKSNS